VQLLSSGIVLTSFIAGIVALLAPCCVSVMLPAYFASGLRHRRQIVGMTFVFAAGVGTVILPIALGASAVSGLLQSRHTPIFATGGALMILAGLATLAGRAPAVPMPFSAPLARPGTSGVWLLGVFSGAATACCAPVLAGVAGLAGGRRVVPARAHRRCRLRVRHGRAARVARPGLGPAGLGRSPGTGAPDPVDEPRRQARPPSSPRRRGSGSARTRASCSLLECCSTASLSRTAGSRNESCGARSPAGVPAWPLTQVPDCARSRDDERLLALQSQGGAAAGRPSGDRARSLVPSGRA